APERRDRSGVVELVEAVSARGGVLVHDRCDVRAVLGGVDAVSHRAELERGELTLIQSEPGLSEENRPYRVAPAAKGDVREQRRSQHEADSGAGDVERALDREGRARKARSRQLDERET